MKKIQILIIHGGMTFKTKKEYSNYLKMRPVSLEAKSTWTGEYLEKKLGKGFEIIRPRMPLQDNAKYQEWKITFDKYYAQLSKPSILIGYSLGGIFLAKYLSENKLPKKALSVYLIAAPFDNTLEGEDLVGGFSLKADLSLLSDATKNLHLLFSEDDDVVPVSHGYKFKKKINDAHLEIYPSKNGHFKIAEFPEIIKMIKNDAK